MQQPEQKKWKEIETQLELYDKNLGSHHKDTALALLWELSIHEFVAYAKKKNFSFKHVNPREPSTYNDHLEDFTESLLVSMLAKTGVETLVREYNEDQKAQSTEKALSQWMMKRMWWRTIDRWRKEKGRNKKQNEEESHELLYQKEAVHLTDDEWTAMPADSRGWEDTAVNLIFFSKLVEAANLSEEEELVLSCRLAGYKRKEGAAHLGISEGRYKNLIEQIFEKLKAADQNLG